MPVKPFESVTERGMSARMVGRGTFTTRWVGLLVCGIIAIWAAAGLDIDAQPTRIRLNRMIEALAAGRPAIAGDTFVWVEQEHQPYEIGKLRGTLDKLLANRNTQGQVALAPLVRIPAEGDQDVRWIIKQVLEAGAMGIIVPHVDTPEQALKIVESIRFPQRKDSKYPNPRGRRGSGGTPGNWTLLTNPADYVGLADLWPLNPDGELFAMPMIESPEGVKNVDALLDVPGVSGVIIGPGDLTRNMGEGAWRNPADQKPDTTAAIAAIAKACVAKRKICGMVTGSDTETKTYLDMGFRIIYGGYRTGATS